MRSGLIHNLPFPNIWPKCGEKHLSADLQPLDKIHYWDKLWNLAATGSNVPEQKQTCEDLRRLLECIKAAPELENYFKTRDSNLGASITSYDTLWTLFAPKTQVIAKPFMKMLQVFEVESFWNPDFKPLPQHQSICVWCWDWNGQEMIRIYYWLSIERFSGTKDINQLSCFPIQYYKTDQVQLRKMLGDRGLRYHDIVQSKPGASQMYAYNGYALSNGQNAIKFVNESFVRISSLHASIANENSVQYKNSRSRNDESDGKYSSFGERRRRKPVFVCLSYLLAGGSNSVKGCYG